MNDDVSGGQPPRAQVLLARLLAAAAVLALFLMVHNYGTNLLPYQTRLIRPEKIQPEVPGPSFAYVIAFREGVPDEINEMRSRLWLWEGDQPYPVRTTVLEEIRQVGGMRFAHLPDRVLFSTVVNQDPRTTGRVYRLSWPVLYSRAVGGISALVLVGCLFGLAALYRPVTPAVASPGPSSGEWSRRGLVLVGAAAVVFVAGLYCSTGTRAPYAVTFLPQVDPVTGHAYNQDHAHFRVLHEFVDGQPREVWDKAIMLRRILYPVITYPAMELLGFEAGGVAMNLLLNLGGFIGAVYWLRKNTGERAAVFAGWLLAFYPGAAYWAGMPYPYALIAPGSILLTITLAELAYQTSRWRILGWALLMGTVYLAYDFAALFLPASLLLLVWRRRWVDSIIALGAQVLPLSCWLLALRFVFDQPWGNSNASIYRAVIKGLTDVSDWVQWLGTRLSLWDTGAAVFFGANFIFLPAMFVAVLAFNRWSSRVRLKGSEVTVIGVAVAIFLGINLSVAVDGGWNMGGSWAARLYQPVFPTMVFFMARWWQALPPLGAGARRLVVVGLGTGLLGNALVLFGPILGNPLGVSGEVFFRFYTHSPSVKTRLYDQMLHELPRQTLGFGREQSGSGAGK